MVGADVDGRGREVVKFGEELAAVLHGGEVGLVVAEPGADGVVGGEGFGEVDLDRYRSGRGGSADLCSGSESDYGKESDGESAHEWAWASGN